MRSWTNEEIILSGSINPGENRQFMKGNEGWRMAFRETLIFNNLD